MTRDELIEYLARAVADKLMTEAEARQIVADFDAGLLEVPLGGLPLTPAESGRGIDDVIAAALALLALLALSRERAREALRDRFEQRMEQLAEDLVAGELTIAQWQAAMGEEVLLHLAAQALAGGDGQLSPEELAELRTAAQVQTAFLGRFADHILALALLGRALATGDVPVPSLGFIINRAIQYAGAGWEAWFRANERGLVGRQGVVVDYEARDDQNTCFPCLQAEHAGPYLPGSGPYPGQVCRGRGRCRCRRVERYDLEAWKRLTGVV